MFRQGFGKIGFFLLVLVTLIVSFTNTWKFLNDFLPGDPPWLRPLAFIFFEGGLIIWAQYFKHDSENIHRTIIAGVMTFVSLIAVLSATGYEVAVDVRSLGFVLPPTIAGWIPLSILLVMLGQTVMLVLHHFADDVFYQRISHMNKTGKTPYVRPVEVTGHLVSVQQTGEIPALPPQSAPRQLPAPQSTQKMGMKQRLGSWLMGEASPSRDILWDAYNSVTSARETLQDAQQPASDVKSIVAAQKEYDAQQMAQLPPKQQASYYDDLASSVGDGSPKAQAPSPNGAKPK